MKRMKFMFVILAMVMAFGLTGVSMAAEQTATIIFDEINVIAASGAVTTMQIIAPSTPGALPADVEDDDTTLAWTANVPASHVRKITAQLSALFPGVDLHVTVAAPGDAGGTSANELQLAAASAVDCVTAIGNCNVSSKELHYRGEVTEMVAPYTATAKTVTWTITDEADIQG
jgi:hypothetical protein